MSKESISNKSNVIRNETEKGRNTGARIAAVLDDINETKIDKTTAENLFVKKADFVEKIDEINEKLEKYDQWESTDW